MARGVLAEVAPGRIGFALARLRAHTSVVGPPFASASAGCGALLLLAAAFDLAGEGRDAVVLGALGVLLVALGLTARARVGYPPRLTATQRCAAVVAGWASVVGWSFVVYLATGTFDRIDDALFESITGATTTSATVLRPLEEAGDGILVWRAATQWLGGLLGLYLTILVVPLALGGRELLTRGEERAPSDGLAPDHATGMRRITVVYAGGAVLLTAAHLLLGLGGVDAVAHAMATVSSGGFSTRSGSIAAFDSPALEWLTVAGMVVAGSSLVVLWWALRGSARSFLRSTELRVYVSVLVGASALVCIWTEAGTHAEVRRAVFTVVSAVSTTGYRVADWDAWVPATHGLLLVLVAVGAMSCSAGGGIRIVRAIGLAAQVRREVVRQLYPHSVQVAKVDGRAVEERTLEQMVGYEFVATALVAVTALAVATLGATVTGAISLAVSALSTFGPGIDAGGAFADATAVPAPARMVLLPAMVLGRLSILPVLLVAAAWSSAFARWLRPRRRLHAARRRW